ncbi:hypothetical protein AB0P15_02450 [Streptomyces sp. NPDC087917]|uniref:hypothetical protein n=1 Tax=Streptomyces sp. NPDC087917 TaxID=3155060 RepID=UPI0034487795
MTTSEQTARETVRRVLGDTAHADVTTFPGGNLSIGVHRGEHTATIDGDDASGWGWTVDPGTDDGFTGHEDVAETLEAALLGVRGRFES